MKWNPKVKSKTWKANDDETKTRITDDPSENMC